MRDCNVLINQNYLKTLTFTIYLLLGKKKDNFKSLFCVQKEKEEDIILKRKGNGLSNEHFAEIGNASYYFGKIISYCRLPLRRIT